MCSRLDKFVKHCSIEGNLDVREVSPYIFMLLSDLKFKVGNYTIVVRKGFITDFASVPKKLMSLVPSYGHHTKAAVLHDYLYSSESQESISKDIADDLFYLFMSYLKTPFKDKELLHKGVVLFGSPFFKEKKRKELYYVEKLSLVDKRDDRIEYEKMINDMFGFDFFNHE